ncbi:MAG: hypothetical protein IT337_09375 [Thermomicrobiales bacterium]|nr:hypothetical protein [Thermomicrobiales bacterium]
MVQSALHIDTTEITRLAQAFGGTVADRIVRDELTTAMVLSNEDVRDAVNARVKHKSGTYRRSFKLRVQVSGKSIVGVITNNARSLAGFVYAWTLEHGRGPVFAKRAKALRFVINGRVIYRKSVGPAKAQRPMEYGARDAEPQIVRRFDVARDKIAARFESLR